MTRNYSKATFEKNLDSVEGLTADQYSIEDDQAQEDNEEDVLSHSQLSDSED